MKKLIYGIAFLAITGGAVLVACNKQNPAPKRLTEKETTTVVQKSGGLTDDKTELFFESVAIVPQSHLMIKEGREFAQRFSLLIFDKSYVPLESYIINGVDYSDDGKFNDQIAGDGIYTSVISKPVSEYKEVPKGVAFVSDEFKYTNEMAAKFKIKAGCKFRTTYSGSSVFGVPCSWGGCVEFYDCYFEVESSWR
jgi:hypothetical protein